MPKKAQQAPPPGVGVGDIAYVLFKHKWKLILISLLGLAGAAAYYLTAPAMYVSEAKLMVRYVVERSAVDQVQNTTSLSANQGADSVIQSEIEILTSWDLAEKVGSMPGMEGLVPKSKLPTTPANAARWIAQNLKVSAGKGSNVLFVSFKHPDPVLARSVLDQLVQLYFIKHLEIHRSKEAAKFVTDKVEKTRTKLRGTEDELTKLKTDSGILSLPDTMSTLNAEGARAQADVNAAESELAEQRARVAAIERFAATAEGDGTQPASATAIETTLKAILPARGIAKSAAPAGATATADSAPQADVSQHEIDYSTAVSSLKLLEAERLQMLKVYRQEHESVKALDEKIARQQAVIEIYKQQSTEESSRRIRAVLMAERAQLLAMEAKTEKLKETLAAAQKNASAFTTIMPRITEKELTRDIEIGNYKYMAASLEKAQVDEALDGSKMPNISIVQEATPATPDLSKRKKIAAGIAGGTSALAIAITLLFGLILNKTINRAEELENRLGLPVMLSIPFFNRNDRLRPARLKGGNGSSALNPNDRLRLSHPKGANGSTNADDSKQASLSASPPAAPWEIGHFIRPFSEAVRDRLGLYFEINGIIHKPRLIGVTSFSHGAGTSTLAAGLAAALSETGEGKVLMVDMTANGSEGEVHPFFEGQPAVQLDDALKSAGQIQSTTENLYLATAEPNSAGSGSLGLNKFRRIMRDLKASDFDYMVFDMPALGQISSSAAMAGLMDQVLVIVESETTSPDEVKRGLRDLADSRAKVSLVFNKARSYGPKALTGAH